MEANLLFGRKMKKKSRILIAIGSLLLLLVFFFPIWRIYLDAPQYPEGLGLNIWINKVTGINANDLNTINGLNHYIGMEKITPDAIPELKIMPWIIIGMMLWGLFTSISKKKWSLYVWLIGFIVLGIIGMIDFYQWEYTYGHTLNPNAPIKVPGMSYQPPLIGSKQLLNIHAVSIPYIGTIIILLVVITGFYVLIQERKRKTLK